MDNQTQEIILPGQDLKKVLIATAVLTLIRVYTDYFYEIEAIVWDESNGLVTTEAGRIYFSVLGFIDLMVVFIWPPLMKRSFKGVLMVVLISLLSAGTSYFENTALNILTNGYVLVPLYFCFLLKRKNYLDWLITGFCFADFMNFSPSFRLLDLSGQEYKYLVTLTYPIWKFIALSFWFYMFSLLSKYSLKEIIGGRFIKDLNIEKAGSAFFTRLVYMTLFLTVGYAILEFHLYSIMRTGSLYKLFDISPFWLYGLITTCLTFVICLLLYNQLAMHWCRQTYGKLTWRYLGLFVPGLNMVLFVWPNRSDCSVEETEKNQTVFRRLFIKLIYFTSFVSSVLYIYRFFITNEWLFIDLLFLKIFSAILFARYMGKKVGLAALIILSWVAGGVQLETQLYGPWIISSGILFWTIFYFVMYQAFRDDVVDKEHNLLLKV